MKITLQNIGVLKQADFEVGDLTIICGKNNTGKTYAAYALYGFLKVWKHLMHVAIGSPEVEGLIEQNAIKIDLDKLRKSLGAVDWARKTCQMIYTKQSRFLKKTKNMDFLKQKQKEIYGRMTSVVKQIKKELQLLSNAEQIIRKFPDIQEIPTIVIAGYPNVGKSSVLRCISKAKPMVAQYPFTTKEIHVGHISRKEKHIIHKYQIIDTPGLLDRPLEKRNDIELQAVAALDHLADIILFIIDPSETCGYSYDAQKKLLKDLKKMFTNSRFIVVENKTDVKKTKTKNLKISCLDNEGIEKIVDEIFK